MRTLQEEAVRLVDDDVTTIAEVLRSIYVAGSLTMPKFAYVAVDPRRRTRSTGTPKADSRADAELALYERELRDIRVTEKKSLLQIEITGPRIKREELMHLSRQLAAFLRAGIPILDAVHAHRRRERRTPRCGG